MIRGLQTKGRTSRDLQRVISQPSPPAASGARGGGGECAGRAHVKNHTHDALLARPPPRGAKGGRGRPPRSQGRGCTGVTLEAVLRCAVCVMAWRSHHRRTVPRGACTCAGNIRTSTMLRRRWAQWGSGHASRVAPPALDEGASMRGPYRVLPRCRRTCLVPFPRR